MSVARNAALAVAVTSMLIVTLLLLVPTPADAAKVTAVSSGALDSTGSFTVVGTIKIPAGEHIPLDYARVLVAAKSSTLAGGVLSSPFCNAQTGSTPSATITNVAGGPATSGPLTGQGYTITGTDAGYGYSYGSGLSFGSHTEVFTGYGYGYGSASSATTIELTIKITGCPFFVGGPTGDPAAASETFRAQMFVGSSAANAIPSFPLTVLFANKDYTSTGAGTIQGDATGVTIVGGPLAKDVLTSPTAFSAGSIVKSAAIRPLNQDLAVGSRIGVTSDTDVDKSAPRFGVPSLTSQFPTGNPLMQFQVVLTKPDGSTTSDLNSVADIHMVVQVPQSYFAGLVTSSIYSTEALAAGDFKIFAYQASGDLKPPGHHPTVIRSGTGTNPYHFDVVIERYSSFAAGSTSVGLPAGGGGSAAPTTTGTQTAVPVTETPTTMTTTTVTSTTVVTPDGQGESSSTSGKARTPGLAVGLLAIALAGAAIVVRRRV